jgi:hypothetical protein
VQPWVESVGNSPGAYGDKNEAGRTRKGRTIIKTLATILRCEGLCFVLSSIFFHYPISF